MADSNVASKPQPQTGGERLASFREIMQILDQIRFSPKMAKSGQQELIEELVRVASLYMFEKFQVFNLICAELACFGNLELYNSFVERLGNEKYNEYCETLASNIMFPQITTTTSCTGF